VLLIDPGRGSVETLVGAIDAALGSGLPDLLVSVQIPAADRRRAALEALIAEDHRVEFGDALTVVPAVTLRMPARARPQPRTLEQVVATLNGERLARVVVPLAGRPGAKLVAEGMGSGTRKLKPGPLGLQTTSARRAGAPPPQGSLAAERAEHLRHRARGATMRARADRSQNRLSRERLQVRHERARLRAAEERLGATGAPEWVRWRSRAALRRVAAVPSRAAALGNQARAYGKRARRYASDRFR